MPFPSLLLHLGLSVMVAITNLDIVSYILLLNTGRLHEERCSLHRV